MATDTTLAEITEQQNILRQKAAAARTAANNAATDEERAKFQAERDSYNTQIKALTAQAETATKQDPATSTYAGVDQNSGREKYYNPVTGQMYLSDTKPSDTQKQGFETTVQQSGAPVDPTNAATATPPAVATASLPVDTNQTAALTTEQINAGYIPVGQKTVDNTVSPLTEGQVDPYPPVTNVIIPEPGGTPAGDGQNENIKEQSVGEQSAMNMVGTQTGDGIADNTTIKPPTEKAVSAMNEASKEYIVPGPPIPEPPVDWRVKLTLASGADWAKSWFESDDAKILKPLSEAKGIVFPYTPTIQMGYKAQYDSTDITHSNYRLGFYKNSYVDDISISAEFTAQDTIEANYLLATMHFFKTVTKMFYGRDTAPDAGTPPPLLFLTGYGKYQFDHLPLVLTSFTFTLPNDVDYIRTNTDMTWSGTMIGTQESNTPQPAKPKSPVRDWLNKTLRLDSNNLSPGGEKATPVFAGMNLNNNESTYVPTKISFSLTLKPIVTRGNISKNYSTQGYAQQGGYW